MAEHLEREWLVTNARGSFALGTVDRIPRRKYHGLLTVRDGGFGEPWNVVCDVGERIDVGGRSYLLHAFDFGDVTEPRGVQHLQMFQHWPKPRFEYAFGSVRLDRTVELAESEDVVRIRYRFRGVRTQLRLELTPFLRGRPSHHLMRQNPFLNGEVRSGGALHTLQLYRDVPPTHIAVFGTDAQFVTQGCWVRDVRYAWEVARGYEAREDLFAPGGFSIEVRKDEEIVLCIGVDIPSPPPPLGGTGGTTLPTLEEQLRAASRQFLYEAGNTKGIIAGYPWFGEWGRDTLIALPGLTLATGDFDRARAVLEGMARRRVHGLIPNIPATGASAANLNSVDASLFFIHAVQWLQGRSAPHAEGLVPLVWEILAALRNGSDPRIRVDDSLSVWMEQGPWALTWMDAVIDGVPVTPRWGRAVEIDALMFNAVAFALDASPEPPAGADIWRRQLATARRAFFERFWLEEQGYLADRHDGTAPDTSLRPNQLIALALPHCPIPKAKAAKALTRVKDELLTPAGLRTLSPRNPAYCGRYAGDQRSRDLAYHQGTVWPWLIGPFADVVARVHGDRRVRDTTAESLAFFEQHLIGDACIGQVSEVFDGDAPHAAAGAPAQAWSVAELFRVWRMTRP